MKGFGSGGRGMLSLGDPVRVQGTGIYKLSHGHVARISMPVDKQAKKGAIILVERLLPLIIIKR